MDASILRLPDVRKRVGLSKSQIYALIARGEFPKQLRLSARASGWHESAITAWVASRKVAA